MVYHIFIYIYNLQSSRLASLTCSLTPPWLRLMSLSPGLLGLALRTNGGGQVVEVLVRVTWTDLAVQDL